MQVRHRHTSFAMTLSRPLPPNFTYISIYDIQCAVADKATVPIYYESRVAKLGLNQSELPKIDEEFKAITEGEELTRKEKLKTKWATLEAWAPESAEWRRSLSFWQTSS